MAEKEKTYIDGMFIRSHEFDNGDLMLKVGVKVEDLVKQLQELQNEKGYVNINISKRKEPSDSGITHYAVLDTFKPEKKSDDDAPF